MANSELDKYLLAEFPDDAQTDNKKGVLASYLKKIFPEAKTPDAMKKEIDNVDNRVKAFYLMSAARTARQGNTTLKDAKVNGLSKEDFEAKRTPPFKDEVRSMVRSELAQTQVLDGWPLPKRANPNFIFNTELLAQVYENEVRSVVAPLFAGGKRNSPKKPESRNTYLKRLGSSYGLDRAPQDALETTKGDKKVPGSSEERFDDKGVLYDEHGVEHAVFRFAMFRPANDKNFLFDVSGSGEPQKMNRDAFEASKTIFEKPQFPKNISASVADFVKKAQDQINMSETAAPTQQPTEETPATETPSAAETLPPQAPEAVEDQAAVAAATPAAKPAAAGRSYEASTPSDCDEAKNLAAALKQQIDALKGKLGEYDSAADGAKVQINSQLETIQLLQSQLQQGLVDNTRFETEKADLEKNLLECRAEKNALDEQIKNLKERIATLEKELQEIQFGEKNLQSTLDGLKAAIQSQNSVLDQIDDMTVNVQTELERTSDDASANKLAELEKKLNARANAIVQKVKDLESQLAITKEGLAKAGEERSDFEKQLGDEREKLAILEAKLKTLEGDELNITEQLKVCGAQLDAQLQLYQTHCSEQLMALKDINDDLTGIVGGLDQKISDLNDVVNKAKSASASGAATAAAPPAAPTPAAALPISEIPEGAPVSEQVTATEQGRPKPVLKTMQTALDLSRTEKEAETAAAAETAEGAEAAQIA